MQIISSLPSCFSFHFISFLNKWNLISRGGTVYPSLPLIKQFEHLWKVTSVQWARLYQTLFYLKLGFLWCFRKCVLKFWLNTIFSPFFVTRCWFSNWKLILLLQQRRQLFLPHWPNVSLNWASGGTHQNFLKTYNQGWQDSMCNIQLN